MKIALFGAGSAQFGYGTLGDIFQSKYLKGSKIALVDINAEALDAVYRKGLDYIAEKGLEYTLSATTDKTAALQDADFVIISIEVGDRFALWDMDWKMPLQFGVPQVFGENGGPGGIFHALRIVPPILEICDAIAEICPDAVVFNYSNPMTAITTTVLRKYPHMHFVGMCHEIVSIKRYVPVILDTPLEKLHLRAAGLNHFSVLLEARYTATGADAYEDIMKGARTFFDKELGYSDVWDYTRRTGIFPETEGTMERWCVDLLESSRPWSDRRLFKAIMDTYGLLPITSDSHLGEYISWAQDIVDHQGILDFQTFYRRALSGQAYSEIRPETQERAVPIMDGIVGDLGFEEMAVNVLNNGALPDFPNGIAVEVPAIVDKRGLTPISFEAYPKGFGALIRSYAGVHDLTAEAILHKDKNLVLQAVLACPMVNNYKDMPRMVDTMIDGQREWLSYLNKE